MIAFFAIIALIAWFYEGQDYMAAFFGCIEGAGHAVAEAAGDAVTATGEH